jgi:hypothetical protein
MFFARSKRSVKLSGSACRKPTHWRYRARLELLESRLAPAVITVTSTDDGVDPIGLADGTASLREAILSINNGADINAGVRDHRTGTYGINDTINFNISAAGTVQTIDVGSIGNGALPALTKPMTINGYTEPGSSQNTLATSDNAQILIELNGTSAGASADGLLVAATGAGSTIEGLCINRFMQNGIELQGGGNTIAGNFVGTNPQGLTAESNGTGIKITSSNSSLIGGTTPGARNIASGNGIDGILIAGTTGAPATGNLVQGNFVGVNASGIGPVGGTIQGNFDFGIEVSGGSGNIVGGVSVAGRNVVGFNRDGIELDNGAQNNIVQGNYSGVGADGVTRVDNFWSGIALRSDDNLGVPAGPGQANEPPVSGNVIGLNPNTNFTGLFNLIEFNNRAGISVFGNPLPNNATPVQNAGNSIFGNSIFHNGGFASPAIGIDLTNGFVYPQDDGVTPNDSKGHGAAGDPNNFQNFPILSSALIGGGHITITGTMDQSVSPNTTYRIEFFASQPLADTVAEGQSFLGATNVTTDAKGHASFKVTFATTLTTLHIITATATNLTPDSSAQAGAVNVFNTSEFSPGIASTPFIAAGGLPLGINGNAMVKVYEGSGNLIASFHGFDPSFTGGVNVAVGDVNGDGIPDIIVAPTGTAPVELGGRPLPPLVKVIDGAKLYMVDANGVIENAALLAQFDAYSPFFQGGVNVAFGLAGGVREIVTGVGAAGGPHVKVIDATKLDQLQPNGEISDSAVVAQFYAYNPQFNGGVYVAAADLNGDGVLDIVTGAGAGGGPHVKVIDGTRLNELQNNAEIADSALLGQFYAYAPAYSEGVEVAADSNNGHPIVVTSALQEPNQPAIKVIDATKLNLLDSNSEPTGAAVLGNFYAYNPSFGLRTSLATADINGDGVADILIGPDSEGLHITPVKIVDGTKLNDLMPNKQIADSALLDSFFAFNTSDGVSIGGT